MPSPVLLALRPDAPVRTQPHEAQSLPRGSVSPGGTGRATQIPFCTQNNSTQKCAGMWPGIDNATDLGRCGFEPLQGLSQSALDHLHLLVTLFEPILLIHSPFSKHSSTRRLQARTIHRLKLLRLRERGMPVSQKVCLVFHPGHSPCAYMSTHTPGHHEVQSACPPAPNPGSVSRAPDLPMLSRLLCVSPSPVPHASASTRLHSSNARAHTSTRSKCEER